MRESLSVDRLKKTVFVHDASGIFAGVPLRIHGKHYTTPAIIEEIRDQHSKFLLDLALSSNKLEVLSPSDTLLREVKRAAIELGEHVSLSHPDLTVLALALELKRKGYEVVIVTDDYAVQNTALYLGLDFVSVKTTGIRRLVKYHVYCPTCGWQGITSLKKCPRCGSPLKKRVKP